MICQACEAGDHDQCNMATWCACDCGGYHDAGLPEPDYEGFDDQQDRTMECGHTPEDCDCDPTPEQEERAAREERYWDCADDYEYDPEDKA